MRQQEFGVARFDRAAPADLTDDARHRGRSAAAALDLAGMLGVDAIERQRKTVRIAFAADLAVGDDIDAGALHLAYRDDCRVILRLFKPRLGHAPDVAGMNPRHAVMFEQGAIDQPVGLRIAADDRGRDQMARIGHGGDPAAGWWAGPALPLPSAARSGGAAGRIVPSLVPR